MISLCLQIPRTDACLVVGELAPLLGAVLVYLGLTLLGVALGALGRDRPSALVVLFVCHVQTSFVDLVPVGYSVVRLFYKR